MIYFDIFLVGCILLYLISKKEISFLNPFFLYFLFHFLFVSVRGIQIFIFGSGLIVNEWYGTYIKLDEIEKAIVVADISLVGFAFGFNFFKNNFILKGNKLERQFLIYREKNIRTLNSFLILTTVLGIFGTLSYAIIPGQASANSSESNIYISLLSSLGVISALILIYERGFRKIYMIYFLVIVALFSIQGYHRYRVLLPAVFILNYYLKLNKLKFPPVKYLFIGFILLIFSFPLKEIGNKIQAKESINLIKIGENSVDELMKGKSGDLSFLEQSAAMIGSMDAIHKVFYGDTYLPILFFWIPKAMWEEKPKLNQWQYDISTEGRDYGQMGQVSLLSGESYANFLYFGAFVIPFLIARFYSYLYYSYRNINVKHRGFLLLLLFNMILFQVWRDGFISLIVFPIVNYLPIVILFFIKTPKQ